MNTLLIIMALRAGAPVPIYAVQYRTENECQFARVNRPSTSPAFCVPVMANVKK